MKHRLHKQCWQDRRSLLVSVAGASTRPTTPTAAITTTNVVIGDGEVVPSRLGIDDLHLHKHMQVEECMIL